VPGPGSVSSTEKKRVEKMRNQSDGDIIVFKKLKDD
jgi:hypothetical protein